MDLFLPKSGRDAQAHLDLYMIPRTQKKVKRYFMNSQKIVGFLSCRLRCGAGCGKIKNAFSVFFPTTRKFCCVALNITRTTTTPTSRTSPSSRETCAQRLAERKTEHLPVLRSDCRQTLYKSPAIWYNRYRKAGDLYVPQKRQKQTETNTNAMHRRHGTARPYAERNRDSNRLEFHLR